MAESDAGPVSHPREDRPAVTAAGSVVGDSSGLEVLDRDECVRLLATATLGRVGITVGALPVVVPIDFQLIDDQVVFRVGVGTKLDAAIHNSVIAFEADEAAPPGGGAWSVSITGMAREVIDPDDVARMRLENVARWNRRGADRYIAVPTDVVSGCRIPPAR